MKFLVALLLLHCLTLLCFCPSSCKHSHAIAPQHPIDYVVSPHGVMNSHGSVGLFDFSRINRGNTQYHVGGLADSFVSMGRTLDFLQAQRHSNEETRNDQNLN